MTELFNILHTEHPKIKELYMSEGFKKRLEDNMDISCFETKTYPYLELMGIPVHMGTLFSENDYEIIYHEKL